MLENGVTVLKLVRVCLFRSGNDGLLPWLLIVEKYSADGEQCNYYRGGNELNLCQQSRVA